MKKILTIISFLLGSYASIQAQGFGCSTYTSNEVGSNEMANFGTFNLSQACVPTTSRVSPFGFQSFVATGGAATAQHDGGHVNGYVKYYGLGNFTFPVGSGTDVRNLTISGQTAATDAYATAWIFGDPTSTGDPSNSNVMHPVTSFTAPISAVSTVGQWDWLTGNNAIFSGTTGTGVGLTITVSIPDMTGFSPATGLRLVGWNGSRWVNLSSSGAATANAENSLLTGTMIAGIQAIGIGLDASLVPVKLISFNGKVNNCAVDLIWTTAEESNFEKFEVERLNTGSNENTKTATVAAKGNNSTYNITDNTAPQGTNLYRLKMIDKDGSFAYSAYVKTSLNCTNSKPYVVYPNPATDVINITGVKVGQTVQLFNAYGQLLVQTKAVNTTQAIPVSKYTSGTYLLVVLNKDERVFSQKIIKAN